MRTTSAGGALGFWLLAVAVFATPPLLAETGASPVVTSDRAAVMTAGAAQAAEPRALPAAEPRALPGPPAPTPPADPGAPGPADRLRLERVATITGAISPKSVVASDTGLIVAQNMMYRHTVTVYDRDHELVATIDDRVRLAELGVDGPGAPVRGAPVEAAFTPDAEQVYVSNYSMYGPGYDDQGGDTCSPASDIDDSFLYRIDLGRLAVDGAVPVGAVPKAVAVTPDGRYVLATNWCSYDLSIAEAATGREVARVPIGPYPRGIAVDAASQTAYVAVMGATDIAAVDLRDVGSGRPEVAWIRGVGRAPRHLVLGPDDRYLYATLDHEGTVARIDLRDDGQTASVATGRKPRSMAISADGRALYVVNYGSDTVSKIATDDMTVIQELAVPRRPIGITHDAGTGEVWVASYSGTITVFRDG